MENDTSWESDCAQESGVLVPAEVDGSTTGEGRLVVLIKVISKQGLDSRYLSHRV